MNPLLRSSSSYESYEWYGSLAPQLRGFAETQRCKFGSAFTSLLVEEASHVVCPTPPHATTSSGAELTLRVELSLNGRDGGVVGSASSVGSSRTEFTYYAPPNFEAPTPHAVVGPEGCERQAFRSGVR